MYAFIQGTLHQKGADYAVVAAGGVGYLLQVSTRTLAALPAAGQSTLVHTYLRVSDDAMALYGFATLDEKRMFEKLIGVTGVGPRLAMAVLSGMSASEFAIALVAQDIRAITRIPGVGRKTAERLILELREKVDASELTGGAIGASAPDLPGDAAQEAVQALMALGYSSVEAARAVSAAGEGDVQQLIRQALKALDSR